MNTSRQNSKASPAQAETSNNQAALQALYEETSTSASPNSDNFAPLKNSLDQWINEPIADESRERMRAAMLGAMSSRKNSNQLATADLLPVNGSVWIRREGGAASIPCNSIQRLSPNCMVIVPTGSRAQVHYGDGSLLLLGGDSQLTFLPHNEGNETMPAAALQSGRLFAWVAKQGSGRFKIGTPRGSISVLGTEFDLTQSEHSTRVIVNEGSVSYSDTPSPAAPEPVEVTLTGGQLLDVPASSRNRAGSRPHARTLTARELRRHVAWARGDQAVRSRARGNIAITALAAVAVVGLIAGWLLFRNNTAAVQSTAATAAGAVSTAARPTLTSAASDQKLPASSSAAPRAVSQFVHTVELETKENDKWESDGTVKVTHRVLEKLPNGTQRIEATLQDSRSDDGKRNSALALGKPIHFTILPDGQIAGLTVPKVVKGEERAPLGYFQLLQHTWLASNPALNAQSRPTPDQQWTSNASGSIPGIADNKFALTLTMKYAGEGARPDGTREDRYDFTVTGTLKGGIVMQEEKRGQRGVTLSLGEFRVEQKGTCARAVQTGAISGALEQRRTTTIAQTSTAPNQPPFTRNLPPRHTDQRMRFTSEVAR